NGSGLGRCADRGPTRDHRSPESRVFMRYAMDIMASRPTVKVVSHQNDNGKRANPRRHFRNGVCAAAVRAFSAGRFYLKGEFKTLAEAAVACGTCVVYIEAAIVLIKYGDQHLINQVLYGRRTILRAAALAKPVVRLVETYKNASSVNQTVFRN